MVQCWCWNNFSLCIQTVFMELYYGWSNGVKESDEIQVWLLYNTIFFICLNNNRRYVCNEIVVLRQYILLKRSDWTSLADLCITSKYVSNLKFHWRTQWKDSDGAIKYQPVEWVFWCFLAVVKMIVFMKLHLSLLPRIVIIFRPFFV